MRSALAADLDCEQSLEAMRHAFRASKFARRNYVEIDAGVVALLNARYYDPSRGQFLSEEPIFLNIGDPSQVKQLSQQDQQTYLTDPQVLNSYSYGRDNPITRKDPNGKFAQVFAGAVIGDVVGIGSQLYSDISTGRTSG